jgi:hypothetical protein
LVEQSPRDLHYSAIQTGRSVQKLFQCNKHNSYWYVWQLVGFLIPWKISVHLYCVSDSGLRCNKHNSYWYGGRHLDSPWVLVRTVKLILPSQPAQAISFPLVRTTTLGQSVYPNIALHISNYYISVASWKYSESSPDGYCHFYYFMCKVYWWLQFFFTVILRLTGNCSKKCQVLSMSGFSYYKLTTPTKGPPIRHMGTHWTPPWVWAMTTFISTQEKKYKNSI